MRARGGRAAGSGSATVTLRDRPGALHRPRPHDPRSRRRWRPTGRSRARPARCSTRSSRSAPGCGSSPGQSASVAFTTLVADHAASAPSSWPTATTIRTPRSARSTWPGPRRQVELRELGHHARPMPRCSRSWPAISSTPSPALRAPQAELRRNRGSQPLLWAHRRSRATGRSCSPPSTRPTGCPTLRQLLAAHHYWRRRGHDGGPGRARTRMPPSYLQELDDRITAAVYARGRRRRRSISRAASSSGGATCSAPTSCSMLRATARVHIACDGRSLGRILATVDATRGRGQPRTGVEPRAAAQIRRARAERLAGARARVRRIGAGAATLLSRAVDRAGVRARGRARAGAGRTPRRCARQRLRRPHAGRRLRDPGRRRPRAAGAVGRTSSPTRTAASWSPSAARGFTWAENSYFYRLTPWHNDPVSDPVSEVLYLRDEDTGELWCADAGAGPRRRRRTPCGTARAPRRSSTSTAASPPSSPSAWPTTRR